jgi:flagellar biosynthetic protein FlhB
VAFAEHDGHERTEQPTGRRRDEARRKGQVVKSADLTGALLVLGAVGAHAAAGGHLVADGVELFRRGLAVGGQPELTLDGALGLGWQGLGAATRLAWPLVVIPLGVALTGHFLQTRFTVSTAPLAPQWSRLSPAAGLGRLLSVRSLAELVRALLKLGAVGVVAYLTLRSHWALLAALGQTGAAGAVAAVGQVLWDLWLRVGLTYLFIGALDYGWQWWQHERSLRMTRQELREETKETEGDPRLRSRLRALHRQMAGRRMMAQVPRATVVVRNPTHVAVALRYESGRMRAPRVVAKGERLLALRIIDVARRHGVPVVEDPPLARALHQAVPVGGEIPPALYRAVAEVLAYVFALAGRRG